MDNLDNSRNRNDKEFDYEESMNAEDAAHYLLPIAEPLVSWYESHARILPWREDPTPYQVWISEIMLQQTRIEAVKPYYERFLSELPDVADLAAVEDDRLMKLWQGLGYYNRARNLKKAAQTVMTEYGGRLPDEREKLQKLSGIGSYTAGAIASIAFGRPEPAVDGNVLRIFSRLTAGHDDIAKQSTKKKWEDIIRQIIPQDHASHFNQGLFEVGELICIPNGAPHCEQCPLAFCCLASMRGLTGEIPIKMTQKKRKIEKITVCILESEGRIALHKRPDQGLLASLYELPNVPGHLEEEKLAEAFFIRPDMVLSVEKLPEAKHIFSHIEWHMTGYQVCIHGPIPDHWIAVDKIEIKQKYALPNAFQKYAELIG